MTTPHDSMAAGGTTVTLAPIVGPFGTCSHECPFILTRGELPAVCLKLKATLDYYDGWLALCDDLVTPEIIAENQAEYRRSNNPGEGRE